MSVIKNLIYSDSENVEQDSLTEYNESLFVYETAMKILHTKLDIIRTEYDRDKTHSDIQSIKYRIKEINSINKKLEKQGLDFSLENIQSSLNDVVGARIVCLTVDDVYSVVDMINKIPSIKVVNCKDYIKQPKESGYRSYHIIIEINVPMVDGTLKPVRCEIQVRTLLMDAWSSLEHEIIYKNKNCTTDSKLRLRDYSYALGAVEQNMEMLRKAELDKQVEVQPKEQRKISKKELLKFKEFLYVFEAAGMLLESNIDILLTEYAKQDQYSDIQKVKFRIKEIDSIDNKLDEQGLEFNLDNITNNVKDVVAARIVCLDTDDVYRVVEMFKSFPSIKILNEKDYIKHPKESGYRAVHLIVEIPVELASGVVPIKAEIQLRTVLMDAWSSLEHETVYKNPVYSTNSKLQLRNYSYMLSAMDSSMRDIKRTEIQNLQKLNSETSDVEDNDVKKKEKKK